MTNINGSISRIFLRLFCAHVATETRRARNRGSRKPGFPAVKRRQALLPPAASFFLSRGIRRNPNSRNWRAETSPGAPINRSCAC